MEKRLQLCLALLIGCLLSLPASILLAQTDLTETYIASDETFAFDYPGEGWEVVEDRGLIYLINTDTTPPDSTMLFMGPSFVRGLIGGGANIRLSETLETLFNSFFEGIETEIEQITIGEREAYRADFVDQGADGTALAIEIGDGVGLMVVITEGDNIEELRDLALEIAETYDLPGDREATAQTTAEPAVTDEVEATPRATAASTEEAANATAEATEETASAVQSLENYAGDFEEAIAELQDAGMIPAGGERIFEEDYAFFSGSGNWFTPLARTSPETNIVMAGEISIRPGTQEENEFCTLTSRIITNRAGDASIYLDVGLTTSGDLLVVDRSVENADPTTLEFSELGLDLSQPHHLLFTVIGETLNVYVDGELVLENIAVEERRGTYGISLIGRGPDALCEGRNIWAYAVARESSGEPIECTVSAAINVNKRNGPGTSFNSPGALPAGEIALADGQATGAEGIPWWRLEDGTWVRSDLVSENGDCDLLPEIEDD
jgi:hypothetical protein